MNWTIKRIYRHALSSPSIQTGYEYGIEPGNFEIRVFDLMIDGEYVDWDEMVSWFLPHNFNLPVVQVVYRGPWSLDVLKLAEATDEYNGKKYVREGVVIKAAHERKDKHNGRAIYKAVSSIYLLDKKNSDNH